MRIIIGVLLLFVVGCSTGCNKGGQSTVENVVAASNSETAKPMDAKPQHFQWQLYLLEDKSLHGGMTKQEIEKVLFSDERSTKGFHGLDCTKPYDKTNVICETSGIVERGARQIPVRLEFWMGDHNELSAAKEAFPIQLADDVRSFLSARFGEPTSYAPTSWKLSAGCGHTGQHPPGECATIALFTSDTTHWMSNEGMSDWGTIDWEDFLTNRDLEEAQKQANGST